MDNTDYQIIGVVLLLSGIIFFSGYKLGRKVEARLWNALIPEQMAALCNDCRGLN